MKYEYVYAGDVLDDDNNGLIFGVEEATDFPDYVEWFKTIKQLEANTKKNKMIVKNREQFLKRFNGEGEKKAIKLLKFVTKYKF